MNNNLFEIEIKNGLRCLTKYLGHASEVTIPDDVDVISRQAFYKRTFLNSVTIPGNVKIIDMEAFTCCYGLKSITLSEGIEEIMMRAFWNCSSFKEISFPASLKRIGAHAFESCSSLQTVHFAYDGTLIDEYAFHETPYYEKALEAALAARTDRSSILHLELPEGFTHIDLFAYAGSNVRTVSLPNSLRTIGSGAFKGCKKLTEVSLSPNTYCNSYEVYDTGIFEGCDNLRRVILKGRLSSFVWTGATRPELLRGFSPTKTFSGCFMLKSIIAWEIPLEYFPEEWQNYAIHGYLYDEERSHHYSADIAAEYDRKITESFSALINRINHNPDFALFNYLAEKELIDSSNYDALFNLAQDSENVQSLSLLLDYKRKHIKTASPEDILADSLETL